jgi:putative effector of murein hydrolase
VERDGVSVVLYLFPECIRRPSETAHVHPHREILALDKRRLSSAADRNIMPVSSRRAVVLATGTSCQTYFGGARFINFLLGPAAIAPAIPIAKNLSHVRSNLDSIGVALLAGSVTSIVSGVAIVWLMGGSRMVALPPAPRAVATPIAMALAGDRRGAGR